MNVQELFRRLSYGELSNLSVGSEGVGTIAHDQQAALIGYANEALLRLFSRFVLKENDLIVECYQHITNYHLTARFAKTNPEPCPGQNQYILDHAGDPFLDDVIRIIQVTTQYGSELPLNDRGNQWSLFTPQPAILQVPHPIHGKVLGVVYQARHKLLAYDDLEACIDLPFVLEGALTAYIAHLVYANMNGQENKANASTHLARYEAICMDCLANDLVSTSVSTTTSKLHERGFV